MKTLNEIHEVMHALIFRIVLLVGGLGVAAAAWGAEKSFTLTCRTISGETVGAALTTDRKVTAVFSEENATDFITGVGYVTAGNVWYKHQYGLKLGTGGCVIFKLAKPVKILRCETLVRRDKSNLGVYVGGASEASADATIYAKLNRVENEDATIKDCDKTFKSLADAPATEYFGIKMAEGTNLYIKKITFIYEDAAEEPEPETSTVLFQNPQQWTAASLVIEGDEASAFQGEPTAEGWLKFQIPTSETERTVTLSGPDESQFTAILPAETAPGEWLISGNKTEEGPQTVVSYQPLSEPIKVVFTTRGSGFLAAVWKGSEPYTLIEPEEWSQLDGPKTSHTFSIPAEHGYSKLAFVEPVEAESRADTYRDAFKKYGLETPYYLEGTPATLGYLVPTALPTIVSSDPTAPATWHTLQGIPLPGSPTAAGIYLRTHQGKTTLTHIP